MSNAICKYEYIHKLNVYRKHTHINNIMSSDHIENNHLEMIQQTSKNIAEKML